MWWVILYVGLGAVSIVVLALLTLRLWRQVRQLGRDVAAAGERVNAVSSQLEQISSPPR